MKRLHRLLDLVERHACKYSCSLKERNGRAIKSIAMTCPNSQTFCGSPKLYTALTAAATYPVGTKAIASRTIVQAMKKTL
jgi:hypothetical protein